MTAWKPISEAPTDRPILVRGGKWHGPYGAPRYSTSPCVVQQGLHKLDIKWIILASPKMNYWIESPTEFTLIPE